MRPWNLTDDPNNNRAPLLCYFQLCASFHSHWWIQTGVIVRKRSIWVKTAIFCPRATLKFDRWPWKAIGHLFYVASSFVHHFIAIAELQLQTGNSQIGVKFILTCVTLTSALWHWPFAWTPLMSMVITPENFVMIRREEHCGKGVTDGRTDGQTDRRTDISVLRAAWSQLKTTLKPSDTIWCHGSWSTLVIVMACCLIAPNYHLYLS